MAVFFCNKKQPFCKTSIFKEKIMKNIILFITLLFSFFSFSQTETQQEPCATATLMNKLLSDFPEARERLESFNQNLKELAQNKKQGNSVLSVPAPASITIPVVVYVVHDGTALTNISDAQVNDQLTVLNNYYYSTGIRFCLANKVNATTPIPTVNTTDVQTTSGIIHVNNPTLSNHFSNSQSALVATADVSITQDRYLRIWVVKSIDGANSGTAGYSMFPNTSPIFDGVVMRYDVFGNGNPNMMTNYNLGKVLVHEIGHYFGLYHTFESGCSTYFNDCLQDGDRVCDTPAVATPNFNCVSGTNSCPETPAVYDDISNYMDYGNNLCQSHFTTGQIERMLTVLQFSRGLLYATENIIYTGTCGSANLLSATITASDYSPCASPTTVTTFTAPAATTYSWNFGDAFATGSNPNTSSSQSATHIYTSATNSPYIVTLTVTNSLGESRTSSEKIFVTNCQPIHNANSYWYVDYSVGLNFATGKPVFDPTFPYDHGAAFLCNNQNDENGNLLFYAGRFHVWNNQHQQIDTSPLLQLIPSATSEQMVIVPKPPVTGNTITQYYIFTSQPPTNGGTDFGFRYSLVNVSNGNVTMGVTAQPITLPSSYGFDLAPDGAVVGKGTVTAVKKCNGNDYWIIVNLKKNGFSCLTVFSLTSNGLAYQSEKMTTDTSDGYLLNLEVAPNGNKLAMGKVVPIWGLAIYDFDKINGLISSNFIQLSETNSFLGLSFSPDSNLLYMTGYKNKIRQYNINTIDINNSKRQIEIDWMPGCLELGPDNKIYVGGRNLDKSDTHKLTVIHNPNNIATNENPNAFNFSMNGPKPDFFTYGISSLPNTIDAKLETAYFAPNTPNVICKYITGCNTYKFFPNVCGTSFLWTFTNTTTSISVTSTETDPTYNFSVNGTYIVTLKDNLNNLLGTSSPIVITSAIAPIIDGSTTACLTRPNEKITNNFTFLNNGETAIWTITGGTGIITGQNNLASVNISWSTLPGTITLTKVNASGCTSQATKIITSFCAPLNTEDFILNRLTISPNPSPGLFTISSDTISGKVNIQVIDIQGRVVLKEIESNFINEKTINLSGFESGIYIIKIEGLEFSYTQKIIKN